MSQKIIEIKGRRPAKKFVCLVIASCALSACSMIKEQYVVDRAVIQSSENNDDDGRSAPPPIDMDLFVFQDDLGKEVQWDAKTKKLIPKPLNDKDHFVTAYSKAVDGKDERNRLQDIVLNRSEEICSHHQAAIMSNAAVFSFSTSLLSTILSTASAAIGGEAAKSAISTASAAVGATGTAIKAEFYQNLLAAAIVRQITESRKTIKLGLLEKREKTHLEYSVDQALGDAYLYHTACSFYSGVIALTTDDKLDVMSRQEIDVEIDALKAENKKGRADIAIAAGATGALSEDDKEAARVQIGINQSRILMLQLQRATAPGRVVSAGDSEADKKAEEAKAAEKAKAAGTVTPGAPIEPPKT